MLAIFVLGIMFSSMLLTKKQHYAFKRTWLESEGWALTVPEDSWSAATAEHGKED
jgi:hypothetical protein